MKLANKLTIFFILLSIIPLTVVGYIVYFNSREAIKKQTYDNVLSTSVLKESEFNRWVNDNKRSLRGLAQRPLVRNFTTVLIKTGASPADPEYQDAYSNLINDHLIPAIEEKGGFLNLFLLRADDGLILAATEKSYEGKFRAEQKFFEEGKNQTYVGGVVFQFSEGESHMHVSTPILDEDGKTIAVLVGHADLKELSTIIRQRGSTITSEDSYLVNAFNFFVTDPLFGVGYALKKAIYTDGVKSCLAGNGGTGIYEDYRGISVLGAYRWMPDYQMCLLTEVDQSEAFASIEDLRLSVLGFSIAVAIFVTLLSLLFAHTLTDPLRQLVESTEEIGRGNLDYRIKTEGKDEISTLAQAFNQMTENLQFTTISRDELDKEIIERKKAEEEALKERDKAQQYLDVAGAIFVVIDDDQTVSLINIAGCKMLGAKENEIVGQNWFDTYIPERNRSDIRAVYKLLMAGEMEPTEYYENLVLTKEGSERIIAWHNALLVDEEGVIKGTLSSGEDITERKKAEKKLRIKDFAFESSSSADSIGSNEGLLTHANSAFANMWGYGNMDEVIGLPILDFLADKDKAPEIIESITNTGKWSGEYKALRKDGSTFIAQSVANAIYDRDGNQIALYSSVLDITERKMAELEIQKLNEELEGRVLLRTAQLEYANKELESFAYSVSHDLRAPLRAIDGFSRILVDEHLADLSTDAQRYLSLVRKNTHDMDQLIDDLLAFSRLARQELVTKRVSPNEIVKLALAELESALEGCAVELTIADLPDCKADPALLKLVYINLLENAIKFTCGKDPATVEIGFIDLDDENVYFVKDNGVGFDMQYADKLFGVFQRLHRAEDFEGTGVGLANVQRIILRHGGRVWAEAEVDQGATFYFTCEGVIQDD